MRRSKRESSEALYRKGAMAWADRNLDLAVGYLSAALDASSGPSQDGWWFSASRTLAQVAMEQGDPGTAGEHLRLLPGHGVGDAMQHALRGRLSLLVGDEHLAGINVSVAVAALAEDREADVGSLMNGAIALMWCGEVLVDLGHGVEARRLIDLARERVRRAGVGDPGLDGGLTMVEVGAARLMGDFDGATSLTANVDMSLSPDFAFQVKTELARVAWSKGDIAEATHLYSEAVRLCVEHSYPAQANRLELESTRGPTPAKHDTAPVETWADRSLEQLSADHVPYAVVLRLTGSQATDAYLDFLDAVAAEFDADPGLGSIDGIGTDGSVWELFLEGDDPDRLWSVVVGLLPTELLPGSHAEIRDGNGSRTVVLGT